MKILVFGGSVSVPFVFTTGSLCLLSDLELVFTSVISLSRIGLLLRVDLFSILLDSSLTCAVVVEISSSVFSSLFCSDSTGSLVEPVGCESSFAACLHCWSSVSLMVPN